MSGRSVESDAPRWKAHRRKMAAGYFDGPTAEDAPRWVAVDCAVADVIRLCEHVKPVSSKTDLGGTYGEPEVFTEWAVIYPSGREVPILREHRWPGPDGEPDAKPCEHYVPTRPTPPAEGRS